MIKYTPITVAELINKLKELPQDAYIVVSNQDSEWGGTHYSHVHDIGLGGRNDKPLVFIHDGLCKDDWYEEDSWDDEEDEDD
jgi:hypothetical protein